jgi:two-component system LytT family sensor kinase
MALENKYKRIIKIALLTLPLQIFFSRTSLISDDVPQSPPPTDLSPAILCLLIALIVAIHFIMWGYNIFSHWYLCQKIRSGKKATAVRYITSYLVALFSTLAAIALLAIILEFEFDVDGEIIVPVLSSIAANTIILIILELLLAQYEVIETKTKMEDLKMLNLEAKHEKLKQQLNPHFLFNSLNALKIIIKNQPENAEKYLIRLSDFLRFSIAHNEHNLISLKDELKFATDFLALQQARFPEGLQCLVNIPAKVIEDGSLPVFSIQLLLENAIKHNSFTSEQPLYINIFYINGCIAVSNNMQQKTIAGTQAGLGLQNLSRRYKIISGDDITIEETSKEYKVYLKIL